MSKIKFTSNTAGTATFNVVSPATNTNRTIIVPDADGTILTTSSTVIQPRGIPLFSVYQSSAQTVGSNASTKINLQTKEVDTNNWFDTTLSRYTPQIAGWYQFIGSVWISSSLTQIIPAIYRNGAVVKQGNYVNASAGGLNVTGLVYMNGTTDYAELWVSIVTGQNLTASPNATYFQGHLVRAD
jgi:hypothetical protein